METAVGNVMAYGYGLWLSVFGVYIHIYIIPCLMFGVCIYIISSTEIVSLEVGINIYMYKLQETSDQ